MALNDPLQFVLEFGVVGSILLATLVGVGLKALWPKKLNGINTPALAGLVAMFVHSFGDFDLRVPGTAVLFWLGLGVFLSFTSGSAGRRRKRSSSNRKT